jgi:hypothetical protein
MDTDEKICVEARGDLLMVTQPPAQFFAIYVKPTRSASAHPQAFGALIFVCSPRCCRRSQQLQTGYDS